MLTQNLGYPRIGAHRELKKACENYWAGRISENELKDAGRNERRKNWQLQQEALIDLVPCNDFSFYDHVIDLSFIVGAIPDRFKPLENLLSDIDLYFAMCRGYQKGKYDVTAMEMTKWFDTNYHYIVPEFTKNQEFQLRQKKVIEEFVEAKSFGIENPKPVLIGPISYLLLGKEKGSGFERIDLIGKLLPVYYEIFEELEKAGCSHIQLDEPFLVTDLKAKIKLIYQQVYREIKATYPDLKIILTTYFDDLGENLELVLNLPVEILHIDLVRGENQLNEILGKIPSTLSLSLGIIDGRNIWKNNLNQSINTITKVKYKIGENRIIIAPSCSFLHVPYDLDNETKLPTDIRKWLAFSKQKLEEINLLKELLREEPSKKATARLILNEQYVFERKISQKVNNIHVIEAVDKIQNKEFCRRSDFSKRKILQNQKLNLQLLPTTTIGSFPQSIEVRNVRRDFRNGKINQSEYESFIQGEIKKVIRLQEEIGLDVLVHGEFERNDMVEYFGEQLEGFLFTENGWVQSYGSRGVKPPIIFGDVWRKEPMTVKWIKYAQSLSSKRVKGMLTGPVTILQWSFVRDDQPRKLTSFQIALALKEEVQDLEKAGIDIIQIDEPALREGLPLKRSKWKDYLSWAVDAFKICTYEIKDETQIHTHMCYAEFNDIIDVIAALDADVISFETSRSQMELLKVFAEYNYPNQIGPGVFDIHSPRIPSVNEMTDLLERAKKYIPVENLWINPDCGLKTRSWNEVRSSLINMVKAAGLIRQKHNIKV